MQQSSSESKSMCFVSSYIREREKRNIINQVCSHLEANQKDEEGGNSYCILHFPNKKDEKEFKAACDKKKEAGDFNFQWTYYPDDLYIADKDVQSEANFSNILVMGSIYLVGMTFRNKVIFYNARINGYLEIKETTFNSEVSFQQVHIHQDFSIQNTNFNRDANFSVLRVYGYAYVNKDNYFQKKANFDLSQFNMNANFDNCEFKEASFKYAKFLGEASFDKAKFIFEVRFDHANFAKFVGFRETVFDYICVFDECNFSDETFFYRVEFNNTAFFEYAKFAVDIAEPQPNFGGHFHMCRFHSHTNFQGSKFKLLKIINSEFKKTIIFNEIEVNEEAIFEGVVFEAESSFRKAKFFNKVSFNYSYFKDSASFVGEKDNEGFFSLLKLQNTRTEKPEHISFYSVRLQPNWFVNTNCKEFVFTACRWKNADGTKINTESELEYLIKREISHPNELLTKTCWQLADNHEDTKSFPEASLFRRMAFESERLGRKQEIKEWLKRIWKEFQENILCRQIFSKISKTSKNLFKLGKDYPFDFIHFLYHWLSGYGEKWFRAFFSLWIIWIVFALGYYFLGEFGTLEKKQYLEFGKSFTYSFFVMILQKPEPSPLSTITYGLYGLETIFAPVQAALLALAIRRKFMR